MPVPGVYADLGLAVLVGVDGDVLRRRTGAAGTVLSHRARSTVRTGSRRSRQFVLPPMAVDQRGRDVPVGVEAVDQEAVEVVRGLAVDARGRRTGGRGGNPLLVERGVDVVVGRRAVLVAAVDALLVDGAERADAGDVAGQAAVRSDRDVDAGGRHRRVTRVELAVGQERLARPLRVERAGRGRRRGIAEHLAVEGEGSVQDAVDAVQDRRRVQHVVVVDVPALPGREVERVGVGREGVRRARPTGRAG